MVNGDRVESPGGNVHNEARSSVDKDEAKEKLERETRTLVEELSRISRR